MKQQRKVILYIAASLDGYIAKPNDDLSFLSLVEKEGEDYGYAEFIKTIDTVIIGRRTYEWILNHVPEFVHEDKVTFVITHTSRPRIGNVQFYTGDLSTLVATLKSQPGQDIFVDGGAQLVHELLKKNLIDEFVISIIPVLVGNGIRLFNEGRDELVLDLVSSTNFDKGLVQMHYRRRENS